MKITDMPSEVLAAIMRLAGQPARVHSMLACKALCSATAIRGAWDAVTFKDLDYTAVNFMLRHRCGVVCIETVAPDDVAWFLDRLATLGCGDCIRDLTLRIGTVQRLPSDLLCAVARHGRLRRFDMSVAECLVTCEVAWPRHACLPDLRSVRIVEATDGVKNVVVWFDHSHPRFETLEDLHIDVGLSDVLVGVCHMPCLRRLVYHFETIEGGESYDDACLEGARLDILELDVTDESDTRLLFQQLERCSVRRLVLHVHDDFVDVSRPLSADLEELVFGMCTTCADIQLDFQHLASQYPKLKAVQLGVTAPWILGNAAEVAACHATLVFQHVDSFAAWMSLFSRVTLEYMPSTRVCIAPAL